MTQPHDSANSPSRRTFLQTSSATAAGIWLGTAALQTSVHAAGSEVLKVGLVGCGGRGTGAARDTLSADPNTELVAVADVFEDKPASSLANLKKQKEIADRVKVSPDHIFTGFDAYKQLIASEVDVVLLATPPHFRPLQLKAAVEAGKHVFAEKPVAVDAPGVRSVLETAKRAKEKNLALVSGLCWRYDLGVRETVKQIHEGAVGDVIAIQSTYNSGQLWKRPRQDSWSDMEWQLRNWLYFTWLSGDHNVEQHIHSLDKVAWVMGDQYPEAAWGTGGRIQRTEPEYGHIYDHHSVVYEYPNGVRAYSNCRQMDGTYRDVSDLILGTKGQGNLLRNMVLGETKWRYRGPKPSMYRNEHVEMYQSIRSGSPINNGDYMSRSTLLAIMGRMATYTGQKITWEMALNSKEDLSPPAYDWIDLPVPPVAVPGRTRFV